MGEVKKPFLTIHREECYLFTFTSLSRRQPSQLRYLGCASPTSHYSDYVKVTKAVCQQMYYPSIFIVEKQCKFHSSLTRKNNHNDNNVNKNTVIKKIT